MDYFFSLSLLQCIMGFKEILLSKINILSSLLSSPSRLSKLVCLSFFCEIYFYKSSFFFSSTQLVVSKVILDPVTFIAWSKTAEISKYIQDFAQEGIYKKNAGQ